jgi:hypothetical protein
MISMVYYSLMSGFIEVAFCGSDQSFSEEHFWLKPLLDVR